MSRERPSPKRDEPPDQPVEALVGNLYEALRHLAARRLSREAPGQTLQPTDLVHEVYLRMVGQEYQWESRAQFFAAAAEAMRRILIDRARRRKRIKRGGGSSRRVELQDIHLVLQMPAEEILSLDEALQKLEAEDPVKATLVKLRFFAGLTAEEAADMLGLSRATVDRYWSFARAWLYHEMTRDQ
jgi:RNA polymerase sigma factor (TIGR02999 family)